MWNEIKKLIQLVLIALNIILMALIIIERENKKNGQREMPRVKPSDKKMTRVIK